MPDGQRVLWGVVSASVTLASKHPRAMAVCSRAYRWLTFSIGFALAAACVWIAAQRGVQRAGIPELPLGFQLEDNLRYFERRLMDDSRKNRIAFIGDSTHMPDPGMDKPEEQNLPEHVQLLLDRWGEGDHLHLHSFRMPGLGPAGMYFALERIVAARPDRVFWAINLRGFSRDAMRSFSYAESAGWMPARKLPEALNQPLLAAGLTADRLLLYKAITAVHADTWWRDTRQLQARAFKLYDPLADWADARVGSEGYLVTKKSIGMSRWAHSMAPPVQGAARHTRESLDQMMSPILRGLRLDHPNLQLLATVLDRFREANIPVTLYIEPFNIEHARKIGLSFAGLGKSLRAIRHTAKVHGASVLDLHALLPDIAFRDAGEHYTYQGEPNGTNMVARKLALELAGHAEKPPEVSARHAVQ